MTEHPLELADLSLSYPGGSAVVRAVSLTLAEGEYLALVGESGSGKTSLARSVVTGDRGPVRRVGGRVLLWGRASESMTRTEYARLVATRVGYVPQDPALGLNPTKRVGRALLDSLHLRGVPVPGGDPAKAVETLLRRVGFTDPAAVAGRFPHELSGGMKQRVLIATAVAHRPRLIVADEPTSALDVTVQREILDLLDELRREVDAAVLLITHDIRLAAERADTAAVLHRGELTEVGPAREVFTAPRSDYARHLVSRMPGGRAAPVPPVAPEPGDGPVALRASGLGRTFGGRRGAPATEALRDVSFTVPTGAVHAIVGESGSGKTTLGRILAGFELPTTGSVELAGAPLPTTLRWSREWRRRVQLIHQHPRGSLDPRQRVQDIVAEPVRNFTRVSRAEARERAGALLEQVHLAPELWRRRPAELSGGQAQRVSIARALAADPTLLVLDEAVSALDVSIQADILDLLLELRTRRPLTYVFISHDLSVVRSFAATVGVFHRGRLVEEGPTASVLTDPAQEYTKRLLGAEVAFSEEGAPRP